MTEEDGPPEDSGAPVSAGTGVTQEDSGAPEGVGVGDAPEGGLAQLVSARRGKLALLRENGRNPYPERAPERTHTTVGATQAFEAAESALAQHTEAPHAGAGPSSAPIDVRLNGRLVGAIRLMGGSAFVHLADVAGRLQLLFRRDQLGEVEYDLFVEAVDAGDTLSVAGQMIRTRRGEVTLAVDSWVMLAKSLLPLPDKWHGLTDREARYRERHLDLLSNADSRERLVARSAIVTRMRRFLDERGFLEVETPVLQPIYGGGAAEPFVTHYRALDRTMYLRIADELYLKRLLIGGLEKVYEIGKDFRNEGIDRTHLPEFTQMECYWAYADYTHMMTLTEELISQLARDVTGSTTIVADNVEVDLSPPWRRLTVRDGILEALGIDIAAMPELGALRAAIASAGIELAQLPTWARTVDKLLQQYVESKLIQPTFLMDYPAELSPLAKRKTDLPDYVERFEPFVAGLEIGNSFTELNDPLDQESRFDDAAAARAAGDADAHPVDTDFVDAMKHGMPPAGGLGIGVDRVVMLLTGAATIRDAVIFPQLR